MRGWISPRSSGGRGRIVKAQKEGRTGRVKALQRLLTTSFFAKALAVKRVTENTGKRTTGGLPDPMFPIYIIEALPE